jgi:hypothetical protein
MKIRELERHLRIEIPKYTNLFHSWFDVDTFVLSSNVATVTTSTAHGLSVGDEINLSDVVFVNPLNDVQNQGNGTALATTLYPNDLTFHRDNPTIQDNKTTIEITGADNTDFNDTFNIYQVNNRRNFYFEFPASGSDYANGSPVLLEPDLMALNGIFTVASVPDTTTFTIAIEYYDFTAPAGAKFYNLENVRIAGDVTDERAQEAYTKQNQYDYWMFVIPDDTTVSRNRKIASDYADRNEIGSYYQQETQEPFHVQIFIPATQEYTPVDAMDDCRTDLKAALIKSLCSYRVSQVFTNEYNGIYFLGDYVFLYNNAVYAHQYDFATTVEIVNTDAYLPNSTAVHNINGELEVELDINNLTTTN